MTNLKQFKTAVKDDLRAQEKLGIKMSHRAYAEAEKLTDSETSMKVYEAADLCKSLSEVSI